MQHIKTQQSKQYDVIGQHEQFDTATERHRVVIVPSHGPNDAIVARRQRMLRSQRTRHTQRQRVL